jgi:hypothetical protein
VFSSATKAVTGTLSPSIEMPALLLVDWQLLELCGKVLVYAVSWAEAEVVRPVTYTFPPFSAMAPIASPTPRSQPIISTQNPVPPK